MKTPHIHRPTFVLSSALLLSAACGPKSGAGGGSGATGASGGYTASGSSASTGSGGTTGSGNGGYATSSEGGAFDPGQGSFHIKDAGTPGHDGGCAGITVAGETIPLDMLVLFDRSKSMTCEVPAGGDRWTATKNALTSFVQNAAATGINIGLTYFGSPVPGGDPLTSSCNPYDYQNPDVEFTALPMGSGAIVASLNAHAAQTDTPTVAGLTGAINHAATWKADHAGHTVIVVLVTDGQPNACGSGSLTDVVAVATDGLSKAQVPTYVVGILSPGSKCAVDPNQPNQADLDAVAKAGGTMQSLVVDTTKDTGMQLVETMNKIRQNSQIPCEYSIPKPTDGQKLDYNRVNVGYADPMGGKHVVYYAETKDMCDPTKGGGWYYDNLPPTPAPTKILLCPSTCTDVTAKFGFVVNITLGCMQLRIPA